jgi:hypothetical protein
MIDLFRMRSEMSLADTEHWRPHSDQNNLAFVSLTRMKLVARRQSESAPWFIFGKVHDPPVPTYP